MDMTKEEIEKDKNYQILAKKTVEDLIAQTPDKEGHALIVIGSDLLRENDSARIFTKGDARDMAATLANAAGSSTTLLKGMLAAVGIIMEKSLKNLQDR